MNTFEIENGVLASCDLTDPIVHIPEGVTKISWTSFRNRELIRELYMPDSVVEIESLAFSSCSNLQKIVFSKNLKVLGDYAFMGIGDAEIELPDSLTHLSNAFASSQIRSILLPNSIQTFAPGAFAGCNKLKEIRLPSDLRDIPQNMLFNCFELEKIQLPEKLESIGESAFFNSGLRSIVLPKTVKKIEPSAFRINSQLESIAVDPDNPWYASSDGVLFDKSKKALLVCPMGKKGTYRVPDGVESIAKAAFYHSQLEEIELPSSLKSIGQEAFAHSFLKRLSIPVSVSEIGEVAFFQCLELKEIDLAPVSEIEESLFEGCKSLRRLHIPEGVQKINKWAFCECSMLTELWLPDSLLEMHSSALRQCSALASIRLPRKAKITASASLKELPLVEVQFDYTTQEKLPVSYAQFLHGKTISPKEAACLMVFQSGSAWMDYIEPAIESKSVGKRQILDEIRILLKDQKKPLKKFAADRLLKFVSDYQNFLDLEEINSLIEVLGQKKDAVSIDAIKKLKALI